MRRTDFFNKLKERIQQAINEKKKVFLHISTSNININKKVNAADVEIGEEEIDIHNDDFDMEFKCENATVDYRDEIDFDSFELIAGENYIALDCSN